MRPVDPRLLRYAAAARSFFLIGGGVALLQTAATVAFAYLVTQLIVRAIAGEQLPALAGPLAALGGVVVLRFVLAWASEASALRGAAVVKSQLRTRVLDAITRLGPGWLAARNSTAVGVTTGPGLDALDTYFARYLPQLVLTAVAMPIVVVVIWWQDWISGLTVALTLPLIPVFMILIGWATQSVQQKQWEKLTRLSTAFLDVVGGLSTLTVYGRQHRQAGRIRQVTEEYRGETMRVLRISFLSGFALELAASLSVALVAVSIGVRLIDGSLGLGVGLFVLLLAPEAFLPIRNVGAQFHAAADGIAAAEEVFAIIGAGAGAGAGASAGADVGLGGGVASAGVSDAQGARGGRSGRGGLRIADLTVRYGDTVALDGFSAEVPAGAVTALSGPSGSGKTSLVNALLGFVPHDGRILLGDGDGDGDGGGRAVTDGAGRAWLAWAGQQPKLISGPVAGNVTLGDTAPDAVLARAALDLVGGSDISLETVVDPSGGGLSGGQAQRVSNARAVYRARRLDCPVIVFDEPTSALDAVAEERFTAGLHELADEGRAVLVVSHRRAVIDAADREITLEPAHSGLHVDVDVDVVVDGAVT
ncbi:thiol reductant ABC exporter subunit CydD [Herbiconiux solani]|uniref:thiol reductant ABC exporter subunit CydD n=1 Tax=Herbiconiux solani TaxID=661329 RepID=UPI0008257C0F|nr:thiol reductant ABC exporter subunit CydD [Herbiconiux solani]